jgi:hypothetical protein
MSYFAVALLLLQVAKAAVMSGLPETPGVYYRQDDAHWVRLQPAPIADMKTSGIDLFIETGGYTNFGVSIVCRGARAALRIPMAKPTFFVREVGSSKDVILIRMTRKKDTRTFKASSSAATVENKGGFEKKDIQKAIIVTNPDKSFSVTPEKELKAGEYLLVFGYATLGFDFGIDPKE